MIDWCLVSTSFRVILRDISLVLMISLMSTPDDITIIVNGQRLGIKSVSMVLSTDSLADVLGSLAHGAEGDNISQWPPLWFPLRVSKAAS